MTLSLPPHFKINNAVQQALLVGNPIVALESTVITHGLPYPQNSELASDMEQTVIQGSATPATIALLNGIVQIGLSAQELEILAKVDSIRKISSRDIGSAIAQKASGGTTVAGTLAVAEQVGIKVFATGGIGGIHRQYNNAGGTSIDISADLPQLAKSPVVVVCAGAKAILDLPATLEYLETVGVPVVGYQTDNFPAFYSRESGMQVTVSAENAEEVAAIARAHWAIGQHSAILVVAPPPIESAMANEDVESIIEIALQQAAENNISGQAVTPFLLSKLSELSEGKSLTANLALLKNNAKVAADIAQYLYTPTARQI